MEKLSGYQIIATHLDNPIKLGGIRFLQAGRYYCQPGAEVEIFKHDDFYELTIVNSGKGDIITNGVSIPIKKNEIYVSFPHDTHGIVSSEDDPLQYDHIAFYVDKREYASALRKATAEYKSPSARIIIDGRINYLTYCVIGELNKEQKYRKDILLHTIYDIIIYLIRDFQEKCSPIFSVNASDGEIFCNRIMNYIDTNIYDMDSLGELSKLTNYNYNYISTLFKKTTGITLRDYYLNRKLETAEKLIKEGKLKYYQIAEKMHYSSGDAFAKAYKKKFGYAPSDQPK